MLISMAVYDTLENDRTWMTAKTLDSLIATVNWERHNLFIIDNGSCQATQRLYAEVEPHLPFVLICNPANVGTARAINQAWKYRGSNEHCCKLDNDVEFLARGWADSIEGVFKADPEIGICGLKRNDLMEAPWADEPFRSTIRMLPHERGDPWLVVEEVKHVMGTVQGFSSLLLDRIGYLIQPGLYGFDDSLACVRARVAGYKTVFLLGPEIIHVDPGNTEYCKWKQQEANRMFPEFNKETILYEAGVKDIYYDGE